MQARLDIHTCSPDGTCPILAKSVNSYLVGAFHLWPVAGKESIAKAYNQVAKLSSGYAHSDLATDILVFTHNDVELLTAQPLMYEAMELAAQPKTGVVGVAGTGLLGVEAYWWQIKSAGSGACMHTDGKGRWMSAFGQYGQVVALDGVFLMLRRTLFNELGGFDESIPGFDFYDIDFTLRAYLAGYNNYTFPLHILHHSVGDVSLKPGWWANRELFVKKWKDVLPVDLNKRDTVESGR